MFPEFQYFVQLHAELLLLLGHSLTLRHQSLLLFSQASQLLLHLSHLLQLSPVLPVCRSLSSLLYALGLGPQRCNHVPGRSEGLVQLLLPLQLELMSSLFFLGDNFLPFQVPDVLVNQPRVLVVGPYQLYSFLFLLSFVFPERTIILQTLLVFDLQLFNSLICFLLTRYQKVVSLSLLLGVFQSLDFGQPPLDQGLSAFPGRVDFGEEVVAEGDLLRVVEQFQGYLHVLMQLHIILNKKVIIMTKLINQKRNLPKNNFVEWFTRTFRSHSSVKILPLQKKILLAQPQIFNQQLQTMCQTVQSIAQLERKLKRFDWNLDIEQTRQEVMQEKEHLEQIDRKSAQLQKKVGEIRRVQKQIEERLTRVSREVCSARRQERVQRLLEIVYRKVVI